MLFAPLWLRTTAASESSQEICGLKPKAFYQRLNGRVDFRVGEIIKCSGRLHLSVEKRNQIFFAEEIS
jgi:hypothetical protein